MKFSLKRSEVLIADIQPFPLFYCKFLYLLHAKWQVAFRVQGTKKLLELPFSLCPILLCYNS